MAYYAFKFKFYGTTRQCFICNASTHVGFGHHAPERESKATLNFKPSVLSLMNEVLGRKEGLKDI